MEEKLCNTIQEFEDIFGNVPFKDLDKIKKYIKNNFVPISFIEKKIEEMEKIKQKDEVDEFGIHSRDWWVADIIQEQFKELLNERNNTDV